MDRTDHRSIRFLLSASVSALIAAALMLAISNPARLHAGAPSGHPPLGVNFFDLESFPGGNATLVYRPQHLFLRGVFFDSSGF